MYKKRVDSVRFKGVKFNLGDIVFVDRKPTSTGRFTKHQSTFSEPMVIVKVLPGDTYRIKRVNEFRDRGFVTTAHVSQLKIWRGGEETDDENDVNTESESESENVDLVEPKRKICGQGEKTETKETVIENVNSSRRYPQRNRNKHARLAEYDCE